MKVKITKDLDFKTLCVECEQNGKECYVSGPRYGGNVYTRITTNEYENEIFKLMEIDAKISVLNGFVGMFFEVVRNSEDITTKEGWGANFSTIEDKVRELKERKERILSNIV